MDVLLRLEWIVVLKVQICKHEFILELLFGEHFVIVIDDILEHIRCRLVVIILRVYLCQDSPELCIFQGIVSLTCLNGVDSMLAEDSLISGPQAGNLVKNYGVENDLAIGYHRIICH